MNIQSRQCSNCACWQPVDGAQTCANAIEFPVATGSQVVRAPVPGDFCIEHLTPHEDAAETELIESYRRVGGDWAATECADACVTARAAIRKASWGLQP